MKWTLLIVACLFISCGEEPRATLPYIGLHDIEGGDTTYHTIPNFDLLSQDSIPINNDSLSKGIYVSDFFYTYCPSVCPKVKSQMLRIYDRFENEDDLKLISFALDPKRDNVERLKEYSMNLGVNQSKWYFLTGDKDEIWDLAEEYLISVREDEDEPGGIFHSGKIILIDRKGHIRSFATGTEKKDVDRLMKDIAVLLEEDL